jgi:hypothetical protein
VSARSASWICPTASGKSRERSVGCAMHTLPASGGLFVR